MGYGWNVIVRRAIEWLAGSIRRGTLAGRQPGWLAGFVDIASLHRVCLP